MTLEKSLWSRLRACMAWGHILRIENSVQEGTPDVNGCCNGIEFWVELKVAKMPKRSSSPVRVDHFTNEQRRWLFDRVSNGGRAYLLLQVDHEYLLFRGDVAALRVGGSTMEELQKEAMVSTTNLTHAARAIKHGKLY
jgi:hypothetical protein